MPPWSDDAVYYWEKLEKNKYWQESDLFQSHQ